MSPEVLAAVFALLLSTGALGWAFSMYGTQREQGGKLEVLERAWTSARDDHDTVVRLEADLQHLSQAIAELRLGNSKILEVVEELRNRRMES